MHARLTRAGGWVSVLALVTLGWRAAAGEPVSDMRWLAAATSGVFVVGMVRLGLFVLLSAPHFIRFQADGVFLSGLGLLRPAQVLQWSVRHLEKRRRQNDCVQVEICCVWHGLDRRWVMVLEKGQEAARLEELLETAFPQPPLLTPIRPSGREGAVAGMRTVVAATPGLRQQAA